MVLGRDYLRKFGSTEFNWKNGRVRLRQDWLQPKLLLRGGNHNERVVLISEKKEITEQDFDINPDLEPDQKAALLSLLMEVKDGFAANPKKPSVIQIGEHEIDVLPTARPVKAKCFRMSPQQEEEVNRQE